MQRFWFVCGGTFQSQRKYREDGDGLERNKKRQMKKFKKRIKEKKARTKRKRKNGRNDREKVESATSSTDTGIVSDITLRRHGPYNFSFCGPQSL